MEDDKIVSKHLDTLYSNMLEQNLCRYTGVLEGPGWVESRVADPE